MDLTSKEMTLEDKHLKRKSKRRGRVVLDTVPEPKGGKITIEEFLVGLNEIKPADPIPEYMRVLLMK